MTEPKAIEDAGVMVGSEDAIGLWCSTQVVRVIIRI